MTDIENNALQTSDLIIQRSQPLEILWRSSYTLAEFKILDLYLSKIDMHNPENRSVIFSKSEMEDLFDVGRIHSNVLSERLRNLMQPLIWETDDGKSKSLIGITLFSKARVSLNESGATQVELRCTEEAIQFFFNIEALGYIKYGMKAIASITKRSSYLLFMHLLYNRFRGEWTVPIDELKEKLGVAEAATYKDFRHFRNLVLQPARQDIIEKTGIWFVMENVKKGRSVVAIKFTVPDLPEAVQLPSATSEAENAEINALRAICVPAGTTEPEFTYADMTYLFEALRQIPLESAPFVSTAPDIESRRKFYLQNKYALLNRMDEKNHIENRFAYLVKMIQADAKQFCAC